MYGKAPAKVTIYSEYVFSNVVSILGSGGGDYDIKALAAACGLKPTHNFKRRVMQLVDQGVIKAHAARTANGGLIAVFSLPEVVSSEEQK